MTKKQELPHISKRIVELREARGLSQKQLGTLAGVTAPAITMWETGKRFPRGKNLTSLARALGVAEAEIMNDTPIEKDYSPVSNDRATRILQIQDKLKLLSDQNLAAIEFAINGRLEIQAKNRSKDSKEG